MNTSNAYLLLPPAVMAFWGIALLISSHKLQQRGYVRLLGAAILMVATALLIQSALPNHLISTFAPATGVLYLCGSSLFSRSIAQKFGVSAHPRWAWCIGLVTLGVLFYFSHVQENLYVRVHALSLGMGLLHLLPAYGVLRQRPGTQPLEAMLYWVYVALCTYILLRPLMISALEPVSSQTLLHSAYWFVTVFGGILFYITLTFLMVGSAFSSTLQTLRNERSLDPLTQLLNRRAFDETLSTHLNANRQPMSVLMADIDHFKFINDSWGHDLGDQVLQDVAQCLQRHTRSHDRVARYGGEEFVVLLPQTSPDAAQRIAQRIQMQLANLQLPQQHTLTMSFGVAQVQDGESIHHAIKRADAQMYRAKQTGRNRICVDGRDHLDTHAATAPHPSA